MVIVKGDNPETNKSRPVQRAAGGGEQMRYHMGMWYYLGKRFESLHDALVAVWPK